MFVTIFVIKLTNFMQRGNVQRNVGSQKGSPDGHQNYHTIITNRQLLKT